MAAVMTWRPEYREDFERLNREWIETWFTVEPSDVAVFRDPETAIVRPGGEIFFVVDETGVQGTCALLAHAPGGARREREKVVGCLPRSHHAEVVDGRR